MRDIFAHFFVMSCGIRSRKGVNMLTTRPIPDLHNYDEVLRDVKNGEPVFLTQNGKPRYIILDMEEYEKINATLRLMSEIEKDERSAREKGWIDFAEIKGEFSSEVKE